MSFRASARILLHLGAELISSDAVALFELVKNSFDAGSESVKVEVIVRISHDRIRQLRDDIARISGEDDQEVRHALEFVRADILDAIDPTAPEAEDLAVAVQEAQGAYDLLSVLDKSNRLVISDRGEGMSIETLRDVFLNIGTRSRLEAGTQQTAGGSSRPVLGEKGVGRLASMRLGEMLEVMTSTAGESRWNRLDIDWSLFSHDSDELLDAIRIEPYYGGLKDNPELSGTCLVIGNLTSSWTSAGLQKIAREEFAKFTDPFIDEELFPVDLEFNGRDVPIGRFQKLLLEHAHATLEASFADQGSGEMRLFGKAQYNGRLNYFSYEGAKLLSTAGSTTMQILESLGPFELEIYWYNRRILTALEGIGERRVVGGLVRGWGGGIMVFRDGFRVRPYGGPDDDWLDLDRRAFAAAGYKVNRAQIIGRLSISRLGNPSLTDQTNREGLRDCEEKAALVLLLRAVMKNELRLFLDAVDDQIKAREPADIEDVSRRFDLEEMQIQENIEQLVKRIPEIRKEQELLDGIQEATGQLRHLMTDIRELAESYAQGRGQLLNLAGVGLTVEIIAHELNRATQHVLHTLSSATGARFDSLAPPTLQILEDQLETIQRRLSTLDAIGTSRRQRKQRFNVVTVARNTIRDHQERFEREKVTCALEITPGSNARRLNITAVRGMIIQILGNLIDNSVYWLRQQKAIEPDHQGRIVIGIDTEAKQLSVTDNGPGIAEDERDRIFEAFYSNKRAGEGKGLGLFISREIARYHGVDLYLRQPESGSDGTCNTFVLTLEGMQ